MKAFETTGIIDEQHRLRLDSALPIAGPSRVRVIILINEEDDISELEWRRAAVTNPVFDFLAHPEEDIYSPQDGKPFDG
jgi:hypothetical protein